MLDEIDAALDDRNVERFASYLHNLAKKTQFIVITHRRGTMEAADVLYGVTMQEQGVSKHAAAGLEPDGSNIWESRNRKEITMGFFDKIKAGLTKTREALSRHAGQRAFRLFTEH